MENTCFDFVEEIFEHFLISQKTLFYIWARKITNKLLKTFSD